MLPCLYLFPLLLTITKIQLITGIPLSLPERNAYGEVHLIATLTNKVTGDVTYMEEWLSTKNNNERGKIVVSRDEKSYEIYYNEKDDFRLLMTDTECQIFKYNNRNWNKKLPSVSNELENVLIMFGPTIYYRIQSMIIETPVGEASLIWIQGVPEVIRGIQMQTARATIEKTLNVTVYRQGFYVSGEPYRIDLEGFLPETSPLVGDNQFLSIDFYLVESVSDLSYQVAPKPGIGCSEYLEEPKSFPSNDATGITDNFYFSAQEVTGDGTRIYLKMFIDNPAKIVRYIVDYGSALMETIYDYNLGISYALTPSKCIKSAMTRDDVGVVDGKFDVKELLWQRGNFLYLGKFFYEHRSGIICDVWEKTEYNIQYEGSNYAKLVTTHYFSEKTDISGFIPYNVKQTLIGMVKTFYNKDNKGNYRLAQILRRDVYDFVDSIPETEYQTLFQVSDCDNKQTDRLWLTFEIVPMDFTRTEDAIKTAEHNLIMLREGIRDNIIRTIDMSPLRIANIEFDFSNDSIYARIMFMERPEVTDALVKQIKRIDKSSIKPFSDKFNSLFDCVHKVSYQSTSKSIAWCKDLDSNENRFCAPIDDVKSLKHSENNLIECEIYTHEIGSLSILVNEFPLSSLHDTLLNRKKNSPFMVGPIDDDSKLFKFQVTNIIYSDMGKDTKESKLLFSKLFPDYKLKSINPTVYSTDSELIMTLGDCYHSCESSDIIDCTGFSFCVNPNDDSKVSCLLTNHVFTLTDDDIKSREAIEHDDNCDVYGKNHILDYVKISDRSIISTVTSQITVSPDQCASKCSNSDGKCKSFDYCDNSICSLSTEIYLDRLSKPSFNCDSYLLKKTENFRITGSDLVDGVMFVEEGVNLDQCASLCYDFVSGNDKCQSFNYCPKGRAQSTCQLSQSKLSSSSKVKSLDKQLTSSNCFNYELKDSKMFIDSNSETTIITSAGGGGLLVIVMVICLIVGFIYGFVGEYIYLRINKQLPNGGNISTSSNIQSATFSWSKQVDDETLNTDQGNYDE